MPQPNIEYWPFSVPTQQNELSRQQLQFLEGAMASGFRGGRYTDVSPDGELFAESTAGRSGTIFFRGRNRWEVGLHTQHERVHAFWTDDFAPAAAAVLVWLRGGDATDVLAMVQSSIIRGNVSQEPAVVSQTSS